MISSAEPPTLGDPEFEELFKPVKNPFNPEGSCWGGRMLETYGRELEYALYVRRHYPRQVWTWVDAEPGPVLVAGFRHVDRLGYIITENGWVDELTQVIDNEEIT